MNNTIFADKGFQAFLLLLAIAAVVCYLVVKYLEGGNSVSREDIVKQGIVNEGETMYMVRVITRHYFNNTSKTVIEKTKITENKNKIKLVD